MTTLGGHSTPLVKITPPNLPRCYRRARLFLALDNGLRDRRIAWISAAAGTGKTALVASYLKARGTPVVWYGIDERDADPATFFHFFRLAAARALPGVEADLPPFSPDQVPVLGRYARHLLEALCERAASPFVVVLDDAHLLDDNLAWGEVLREGFGTLPDPVKLIGISRHDVPRALARHRASGSMVLLTTGDLRLDSTETSELVSVLSRAAALSTEEAQQLHQTTDGWAAGVVLMLEWMRLTGARPLQRIGPPGSVFDYFAAEVLERLEEASRRFLLETAVLPEVSPEVAEQLTGLDTSATLLERLSRNNYFTEQHLTPTLRYRYHPLFKSFLRERARGLLTAEAWQDLHRRAMNSLSAYGQIEQAVEAGLVAEDWSELRRLILEAAPTLAGQGRHALLTEWLDTIPEERLGRDGWLLYWSGVGLAGTRPPEAIPRLTQALERFRHEGDPEGCYLAWAEWTDALVLGMAFPALDGALDLLNAIRRAHPDQPSAAVAARIAYSEFVAVMWRDPGHPRMDAIARRVEEQVATTRNPMRRDMLSLNLCLHHFIRGELAAAEKNVTTVIAAGDRAGVIVLGLALVMAGCTRWMRGDFGAAEEHLDRGLELCEQSGVRHWETMLRGHRAGLALCQGDHATAARQLEILRAQLDVMAPFQASFYHTNAAWAALAGDDPARALSETRSWRVIAESIGERTQLPYLEHSEAQSLLELGELEAAEAALERALQLARSHRAGLYLVSALLTAANLGLRRRDEAAARRHLTEALSLARREGIYCTPLWRREVVARLCVKALEWEIEPDFVARLIDRAGLSTLVTPHHLPSWPWPFKIKTMRRFQLLRDGTPLRFGRKTPRRPLDLLQALIALGSVDVPMGRLIDVLWPDAEGDAATKTFHATLHRLRELLGDPELIALRDSKLSLDRRRCWVDLWALERLFERLDGGSGEVDAGARARLLELYVGPFLHSEGDLPWYGLALRDRLRERFERLATRLGSELEEAGAWVEALRFYEDALDAEQAAEPLYQGLMRCQIAGGNPAAAVATFGRCKEVLEGLLGIAPSAATVSLLETARRAG